MAITAGLPMRFFRAEVTGAHRLTPGMARVVLGGPGMTEFRSTGVGDEYLRIIFPAPGEAEPVAPVVGDDGSWSYPDGAENSPMRTYTVREFRADRGEIVVDVVLHDGGVAAEWARRATPGDVVAVNTPTGLYAPPADLSWQFLLTDCAGLPAVARILQGCRPGVRTRAIVEVPSDEHRLPLVTSGDIDVVWIRGGNGHGPSRLEEVLRATELPAGTGYVWVAGETAVLRGCRRYLRHELKLPATAYKTVGYWTDNAEEWNERFERLDEQTREWLWAAWRTDASEEEQEDEYEARLESLGL